MFKQRKIWTDDECRWVHDTTLELLEKEGIGVDEKQARDDMEKAGCRVDDLNQRVYIPKYLVEECIRSAPSSFSMYDSYGKRYVTIGGDEVSFGPSGFCAYYLDWKTGEIKESDYEGLVEETKLIDVLDEVNYIKTSIQPQEKPSSVQDLWMAKGGLVYTRKPVHTSPFGEIGARGLIEMNAEIMGGGDILREKPHLIYNICTLSPLRLRRDASEAIREGAKYKIPSFITSGPMAGATSPVTLAGEVAQAWAEVLGHLVLQQIYQPGTPAIVASFSRIFDMRYATCTVGTPEYALMRAAITQLGKMCNLPTGGGGLLTDANLIDAQYGYEKMMTGIATMQAKQNTIWGMGMLSQLNIFSHEALVIDCEIVRHIQRLLEGIIVDQEHLAYDLIAKEGGVNGNGAFLRAAHTRKHFRTEVMEAELTDRRAFQTFEKDETRNDIRKRACLKIEDTLAKWNYTKGLEKEEALDRIIEKYRKIYEKNS